MAAVVVGYVASPEGEAAIRQGVAEARLRSGALVVIFSDHGAAHDAASAAEHSEALDRANNILAASGIEYELRHLVDGHDPVHDVLSAADEVHADLIVIGIRRRSPVGKLVLGSHSQSILLEASIPVLAVKA
jgi:nucleotide-binding universal stress UspA family protein